MINFTETLVVIIGKVCLSKVRVKIYFVRRGKHKGLANRKNDSDHFRRLRKNFKVAYKVYIHKGRAAVLRTGIRETVNEGGLENRDPLIVIMVRACDYIF